MIIGDRNFSIRKKYNFSYDLSEQWKLFTGLPFVFACWITNKEMDERDAIAFYKSLKFGIESRDKVVKELKKQYDEKLMYNYLHQYINYNFDNSKKRAMDLFLKLCKKING